MRLTTSLIGLLGVVLFAAGPLAAQFTTAAPRLATAAEIAAKSDRATPATLLRFRLPFMHTEDELRTYLKETSEGFRLFSRFAANVSDEEAYVVTDVISGLIGRATFAINYAAVVVKSEEQDESDRKTLEDDRGSVMRMINNGGTITARFGTPLWAVRGRTLSVAASTYFTAGLIGPLGNTDSLRFATGAVGEVMTNVSIRDLEGADLLGDLLIGARVGWTYSESQIVSTSDRKALPFVQLAVGLLQKKALSLSTLVTWPLRDDYDDLTPRLIVNFSVVR